MEEKRNSYYFKFYFLTYLSEMTFIFSSVNLGSFLGTCVYIFNCLQLIYCIFEFMYVFEWPPPPLHILQRGVDIFQSCPHKSRKWANLVASLMKFYYTSFCCTLKEEKKKILYSGGDNLARGLHQNLTDEGWKKTEMIWQRRCTIGIISIY